MNVRFLGILLLAVLTFFGCDDTTGTLGLDMLPGNDNVTVKTKTYKVNTKSFLAMPKPIQVMWDDSQIQNLVTTNQAS